MIEFLKGISLVGDLITITKAASELAQSSTDWNSSDEDKRSNQPPSVGRFNATRALLKSSRRILAETAYLLPEHASGHHLQGVPLLCHQIWIPSEPIKLATPNENLSDDTDQLVTTSVATSPIHAEIQNSSKFWHIQQRMMPVAIDSDNALIQNYCDAIRRIEKPSEEYFINRRSYRLVDIWRDDSRTRIDFETTGYFDYLNVGEVLCHELADVLLDYHHDSPRSYLDNLSDELRLRKLAGDWENVRYRNSIAGINNLTVVDSGETRTFLMMRRNSALGSAMGTRHVIPAGEFQPSQTNDIEIVRQCTLWQTLMREFAEEVLKMKEAKFNEKPMVALAKEPPLPSIVKAISTGHWKTWYLGTALDPLSLKPEIMLVSVIGKNTVKNLLAEAGLSDVHPPRTNHEGELEFGDDGWGYALTEENLIGFANDRKTLPAAAGCCILAARHLDRLNLD